MMTITSYNIPKQQHPLKAVSALHGEYEDHGYGHNDRTSAMVQTVCQPWVLKRHTACDHVEISSHTEDLYLTGTSISAVHENSCMRNITGKLLKLFHPTRSSISSTSNLERKESE